MYRPMLRQGNAVQVVGGAASRVAPGLVRDHDGAHPALGPLSLVRGRVHEEIGMPAFGELAEGAAYLVLARLGRQVQDVLVVALAAVAVAITRCLVHALTPLSLLKPTHGDGIGAFYSLSEARAILLSRAPATHSCAKSESGRAPPYKDTRPHDICCIPRPLTSSLHRDEEGGQGVRSAYMIFDELIADFLAALPATLLSTTTTTTAKTVITSAFTVSTRVFLFVRWNCGTM